MPEHSDANYSSGHKLDTKLPFLGIKQYNFISLFGAGPFSVIWGWWLEFETLLYIGRKSAIYQCICTRPNYRDNSEIGDLRCGHQSRHCLCNQTFCFDERTHRCICLNQTVKSFFGCINLFTNMGVICNRTFVGLPAGPGWNGLGG